MNPSTDAACLHLFCGKAGSGKSTLAKAVADAGNGTLISEDVWLAHLYGDEMQTFDDYRRVSLRLRKVIGPHVVDLLRSGRTVVLDFPANTRAARAWLRSLSDAAGVPHLLHVMDMSDATCLQRIDQRNQQRPEGSHHLTPEQFVHISSFFEPPAPDEGFNIRKYA
jgi:predicted kinase